MLESRYSIEIIKGRQWLQLGCMLISDLPDIRALAERYYLADDMKLYASNWNNLKLQDELLSVERRVSMN